MAAADFAVQRVVNAATAPRPETTAPNSPFNWRGTGGTPATEGEQQEPDTEPAPSKPARRTAGANPQFRICSVLMAKGDRTRDELLEDTGSERNAFTQALFAAKTKGRVELVEQSGKFRITDQGREWATGGANIFEKPVGPSPALVKRSRREPAQVGGELPGDEQERLGVVPATNAAKREPFRCWVDNYGGFTVTKNGNKVELDADEHKAMLTYLDRMGQERAE